MLIGNIGFTVIKMKRSNRNLTDREMSWINHLQRLSSESHYNINYMFVRRNTATSLPSPFFPWSRVVFVSRDAVQFLSPEDYFRIFLKSTPSQLGKKWILRILMLNTPLTLLIIGFTVIFFPANFKYSWAVKFIIGFYLVGKMMFDSWGSRFGGQVAWVLDFMNYESFSARKYLVRCFRHRYSQSNIKYQVRKIALFGQAAAIIPDHRALQIILGLLVIAALSQIF